MEVTVATVEGQCVVTPHGSIDSTSAPDFERALLLAIGASAQPLVVDCTAVSYATSAGVHVLVIAAKALAASARRLQLVHVGKSLRSVLEIANLGALMDLAP
ncbi:MAG TPA: STAS domain-containing protein [Burkholderiales bacterium]|nr:STAS domain-containing protein [Burkholderiales bacterium]